MALLVKLGDPVGVRLRGGLRDKDVDVEGSAVTEFAHVPVGECDELRAAELDAVFEADRKALPDALFDPVIERVAAGLREADVELEALPETEFVYILDEECDTEVVIEVEAVTDTDLRALAETLVDGVPERLEARLRETDGDIEGLCEFADVLDSVAVTEGVAELRTLLDTVAVCDGEGDARGLRLTEPGPEPDGDAIGLFELDGVPVEETDLSIDAVQTDDIDALVELDDEFVGFPDDEAHAETVLDVLGDADNNALLDDEPVADGVREGELEVDGDFEANELSEGEIEVDGDCEADELSEGEIEVDGDFEANELSEGEIEVDGDFEAIELTDGELEIKGDLDVVALIEDEFDVRGEREPFPDTLELLDTLTEGVSVVVVLALTVTRRTEAVPLAESELLPDEDVVALGDLLTVTLRVEFPDTLELLDTLTEGVSVVVVLALTVTRRTEAVPLAESELLPDEDCFTLVVIDEIALEDCDALRDLDSLGVLADERVLRAEVEAEEDCSPWPSTRVHTDRIKANNNGRSMLKERWRRGYPHCAGYMQARSQAGNNHAGDLTTPFYLFTF